MGLFDWLTGSKAAPAGVARQPAGELRTRLLAVNRDSAPFVVRDGAPEGVDLVAEWKIVDANGTRSSPRPGSSARSRC